MFSILLGLVLACNSGDSSTQKSTEKSNTQSQKITSKTEKTEKRTDEPKSKKPIDGPSPVQEPLNGGPYPGLLVSQAWFWKDAAISHLQSV